MVLWDYLQFAGNVHDAKIFRQSESSMIPTEPIQCLADSGYVGIGPDNHCVDYNICFILSFLSFLNFASRLTTYQLTARKLIAQPRKKKNSEMTHTFDNWVLLEGVLICIEPVNSRVRKFRGVHTCNVKKISTFKTFLSTALISITY